MWFKPSSDTEPIGLIAGGGDFPVLLAETAHSLEKNIIVIGLRGCTDPAIERFAAQMHTIELGAVNELVRLLKLHKIKKVILAGGIPKKEMYNPSSALDETAKSIIKKTSNRGDDHLLKTFQIFLKIKCGVSVMDSRIFLKDALSSKGVMTRRQPSASEMSDLKFGWRIAKGIGRMDIGQTVAVKDHVVLAVEAMEGTNAAIRRANELSGQGAVIVKAVKPNQDLKFDLPCVGLGTLEVMKTAGSRVLGIEAGKTLMLFKKKFLEKADQENFTVVGL